MARELAHLMVKMSADSAQLRRDMRQVTQSVGAMERRMATAANAIKASFAGIGMTRLVREFTQASDTYTKLNSRIKLVTASAAEQAAVQQRLFESAQRTRTAYAGTAELYARVARNVGQLGVSQAEVLRLTESVNQAIQIGGATAQEAAGGVIQFTQAMSAGLGGEELRSVTENMPRLAEAIMRGLEAIGVGARVTLRELRALGEARELTPDRLFRAIMTQVDTLDGEFAQLERTVGQAMTQLSNDVQRAMARADMQPLIDGIDGVRDILSDPATLEAITFFGTRLAQSINLALIPVRELGRTIGWFINQFDLMKGEQGAIASGDPAKIQARIAALRQEIDDANNFGDQFRGFRRTPEQLSALRAEIMRLEKARQAVARGIAAGMPDLSLKPPPLPDIPQLSDAATQAATAQEKRLQQIKSIVAALEEENATLGMNAVALAEYELAALGAAPATIAYAKSLAAATEAALADVQAAEAAQRAREDLAAEIEQIANETFAALMTPEAALRTAAALREERVRQSVAERIRSEQSGAAIIAGIHEKLNRDLQDMAEKSKDQFTAFAEEAAANVQNVMADTLFNWMQGEFGNIEQDFKRMLDRMVANALAARLGEALFGAGFGAGGGSELGGLFGRIAGAFGGARAAGGPVSPGRAYLVGEKGPELMVPSGVGRIVPNDQLGGGGVVVNINVSGVRDSADLRQSSGQVAAQAGLAVQRAMRRNT